MCASGARPPPGRHGLGVWLRDGFNSGLFEYAGERENPESESAEPSVGGALLEQSNWQELEVRADRQR